MFSLVGVVVVGVACFLLGYVIPEPQWVKDLIAKFKGSTVE